MRGVGCFYTLIGSDGALQNRNCDVYLVVLNPSGLRYTMNTMNTKTSLNQGFVLDALLQHNFLPNHKDESEELPPIISSISFTKSVAESLASSQHKRSRSFPGYDTVEYRLTRFNGVSRACSIPHPKPYAQLALCIANNWNNLKYTTENINSKSRPRRHEDGRICSMTYEDAIWNRTHALKASFGMRFVVHTDISNFFPSIYSHAIPWALVGVPESKKHRSKGSKWFNKLDKAVRETKRNETQGVAIGPATSSILAEAILARVDEELSTNFTYHRYIDDYTAYCQTHDKGKEFIAGLAKHLSEYKLVLNVNKTHIQPLPQPSTTDWIDDLNNALPERGDISVNNAMNYLDLSVRLARQVPDGSVLKYALKSLRNVIFKEEPTPKPVNEEVITTVLRYALNYSFHQPVLIPLLERFFDALPSSEYSFEYGDELRQLLREFTRAGYSDAICWTLYLSKKYGVEVEECSASRIIAYQDCMPILFLYLSRIPGFQDEVVQFATGLDKSDLYGLDSYWLLLYQLYLDQLIANPYKDGDPTFDIMKNSGVNFVQPVEWTS